MKDLNVFLFIGQSNMSSRAPIESTDTGEVENTFLLNSKDELEPATFGIDGKPDTIEGYNRYSTVERENNFNGYSCGVSFAQALQEAQPGSQNVIVSNAIGNTSLQSWRKDAEERYYYEALRRCNLATQKGTLRGIFWHQGEADCNNEHYLLFLRDFVDELREFLLADADAVPFICGQLMPIPQYEAFNKTITDVDYYIPNADCVSNEGFCDIGDEIHLDRASQILLGQRFAQAYLDLTK